MIRNKFLFFRISDRIEYLQGRGHALAAQGLTDTNRFRAIKRKINRMKRLRALL